MPWTKDFYPISIKNLPEEIRSVAINFANAMLEEKNMEEGIVIATVVRWAKVWAKNRDLPMALK